MQTYDSDSAGIVGLIMALYAFLMIFGIITYVIMAIANWRIFEKAGKPGWAALIPIYNAIVFLEIIGKPIWWLLLIIFPCTTLIFAIWATNLLSKSFGQGTGFTVGLLLLPHIFYPILGFGNFQYQGPAGDPLRAFAPIDPSTTYRDPFNPPAPPAPNA